MNNIPATENISKRSVLLVATFAAFLTPFLGSAVNLALPSIGKDMSASAIGLGWVISSFLLSSAIFLLPFGRIADIIGRKKVFFHGILLFTISTFLIIFAWNLTILIILRIFQGLASAMIFGTSLAIITSVFQPGERGKAMGIYITAVYLGLSLGPVIGGLLTKHFGWRSIFAFLVPFGIISLILIQRRIKTEWAESSGEKFDWKGSVIYGIALASSMYGFSKLPSSAGWICLAAGVIAAALFFAFENRTENPVFDIRLMLNNRVFAFSGLAALINYSATSAIGFFISLYLQYIKGLDARSAGLLMIAQPIAMTLLSPVAGKLSDKKNPGIIASIGMGITAAGLILLCFINDATPNYMIALLMVLMGTGFGLFSSPNSNAIMSSVERRHLGVASGVVGTMRMIGQMMSMGIAMMLISLYMGKSAITSETHPLFMAGMRTGFLIFSALSFFGIFASLARNKKLGNKSHE